MPKQKITSPIEGFTGRSVYGSVVLDFTDGVAQIDDLSDRLEAYLRHRGYEVSGSPGGDQDYNPDEHTVDEVNDYLSTADEQERARVLDAEVAARGRVGIVEGPHAEGDES